jgi:hypothetical protein
MDWVSVGVVADERWSDRADLLQLIFTRRDEHVRIFLAEAERRPNLQPAAIRASPTDQNAALTSWLMS